MFNFLSFSIKSWRLRTHFGLATFGFVLVCALHTKVRLVLKSFRVVNFHNFETVLVLLQCNIILEGDLHSLNLQIRNRWAIIDLFSAYFEENVRQDRRVKTNSPPESGRRDH